MTANTTSPASRCSSPASNSNDEAYDEAKAEAPIHASSIEAHPFSHHRTVRFVSQKPYNLEPSYLLPDLHSSSTSTFFPSGVALNSYGDRRNGYTTNSISIQHAFSPRDTNTEENHAGMRFRLGERRVGGQAPTPAPLVPPFQMDNQGRAPRATSGCNMRVGITHSRRRSEPEPTRDWWKAAGEKWLTDEGIHHDTAGTRAHDDSPQLRRRGRHTDLHMRYDLCGGGARRHSVAEWVQRYGQRTCKDSWVGIDGLLYSVQQIQAEVPLQNTPDDGYEIPPNSSIRIPFNHKDEPFTSTPYPNVNTNARGNRALVTIEKFYKEPTDGKRYMDTSMEDIDSAVTSIRRQLCEHDEEIRQLRREIAHMRDQHELQIARLQGQTQGKTQMIAHLQEQLNQITASVMRNQAI